MDIITNINQAKHGPKIVHNCPNMAPTFNIALTWPQSFNIILVSHRILVKFLKKNFKQVEATIQQKQQKLCPFMAQTRAPHGPPNQFFLNFDACVQVCSMPILPTGQRWRQKISKECFRNISEKYLTQNIRYPYIGVL